MTHADLGELKPLHAPRVRQAPSQPAAETTNARLNRLRAGVLGANDGIVSMSGMVIGVAAAGASPAAILTAGLAGIAAGALSMGAGEYVSVSTQRDTQKAMLRRQRSEIQQSPDQGRAELVATYESKGLTPELARQVADRLYDVDPLAAHAEASLGIDEQDLTSPWAAAAASIFSFLVGSLLPTLVIVLVHGPAGILATVVAAAIALALTGWTSATLGGAPRARAVARNLLWGLAAMAVTWGIGTLVGQRV